MTTTISKQPRATTVLLQDSSLNRAEQDVLLCPVEVAARIIGQKWTLQIVKTLLEEERVRFCELQDALGGVNPTTLSTRLKLLEENGLVRRTQISDLPPHVEYSLTEMGRQLDEVLQAVVGWSRRWLCPE
ncbi:MAG: helix-turn-helix domain-containing protein [Caldilineaceae bacterium]